MSYISGSFLFVVGFAMIVVARPKGRKDSWAARFAFLGELYAVAAISLIVLGVCIAVLS
jgi:uncharacterized membrane protein